MPTLEITTPSSTPGVTLAGTLELPEGPARGWVLLLSGSGPQDRNQTVFSCPTFATLRAALGRAGYAAYSWDDRGVGRSSGDYLAGSSTQLVADAAAVIDYLATDPASGRAGAVLQGLPLVVAGHSQGTLVGALLAGRRDDIDGLVLMAGPGRSGREILLQQHRRLCEAHGVPAGEAEAFARMKSACFDLLELHEETLTDGERHTLRGAVRALVLECPAVIPDDVDAVVDDLMEWEWRFLLRHPTAETLRRVPCATLVVVGGEDLHVDPVLDPEAIRGALEAGRCPSVRVEKLPGLDHIFGPAGPNRDRSAVRPAFDRAAVDAMTRWLDHTTGRLRST